MNRLNRLFLMTVMAAFVLGVVEVSSASASCSGGTQSVFCFSNNEEIHSEEGLGALGLVLFGTKLGANEIKAHCSDGKGAGKFELLGHLTGSVELFDCVFIEPATGCGLNEPIIAKFTGQLSSGTVPATALLTGAGAGVPEEFTVVTVTGASCAISAGNYTVSGKQTVEFPSGETALVEHTVVAKKSGSKIKVGREPGSFSSTASIHLTSKAALLIMLGI